MAASVPVEINNLQTQTKSVFFYSVHVASIVSSVYDGMYACARKSPSAAPYPAPRLSDVSPSWPWNICNALWPLLASQALQHFRSLETQFICAGCFPSQSICLYWLVLTFPRQHIHKGCLQWFSPQQSTLTTMFSHTTDEAVCVVSQMQISLPVHVTAGLQFRTSAWVITESRNHWWSRETKACGCTCIGWNASILFICFVDLITYRLLSSSVILLLANVQRIKNIQTSFNKTSKTVCKVSSQPKYPFLPSKETGT